MGWGYKETRGISGVKSEEFSLWWWFIGWVGHSWCTGRSRGRFAAMPSVLLIFGAPSLQPDSKEISRTQQRCSERQLSSSSGASHWARIEPVNVRKKKCGDCVHVSCGSVVRIAGIQTESYREQASMAQIIQLTSYLAWISRRVWRRTRHCDILREKRTRVRIIHVSYLDATLCFDSSADYSVRRQHAIEAAFDIIFLTSPRDVMKW